MKHKFSPETLSLSYGYKPELSEGAVKCPIFQTSTFVFQSAQHGKDFFEIAHGKKELPDGESQGLIYSRINNPDLQILEERLCLWDKADDCAIFESGMSAISTVLLEFLKPGDVLLYSNPIYGGTDHFIKHILPEFHIEAVPFYAHESIEEIDKRLIATEKANKLKVIYIETPANPTNDVFDIESFVYFKEKYNNENSQPIIAVDNTYMGPLWSHPLDFGADLIIYSATKYIGGHSDVIAGAVLGKNELMKRIKIFRTFLGNMAGPWTGWLLLRSLETLKVRMKQQAKNAKKVVEFLEKHPKVEKIYYLGRIPKKSDDYKIYKKQYKSAGAMIAFDIKGAEKDAFTFLDHLLHIKLAVSLGSTESLAEHPFTMTHSGVDEELKNKMGLTEKMVRLSIGVENYKDIIYDISQALDKV